MEWWDDPSKSTPRPRPDLKPYHLTAADSVLLELNRRRVQFVGFHSSTLFLLFVIQTSLSSRV